MSDQAAPFVHPSADVESGAELGAGCKVWRYCHVMGGAKLGPGTQLGQGCFVASGVRIGARVRVQNNVSIYSGVTIEDDVFVGPSVVFSNVRRPRAFISRKDAFMPTQVRRGATLGANATLLPGVSVGEYAFVAAGAVLTRDAPDFSLMVGVPARLAGWVSRAGAELAFERGYASCSETGERYRLVDDRVELAPES